MTAAIVTASILAYLLAGAVTCGVVERRMLDRSGMRYEIESDAWFASRLALWIWPLVLLIPVVGLLVRFGQWVVRPSKSSE